MITQAELLKRLRAIPGVRPQERDGRFVVIFKTDAYKDTDGDKLLFIFIKLEENGEYIKIYCPMAWAIKGNKHAAAFREACMEIQFLTKLLQFEYDPRDGEIRPMIEWPIEDGTVTSPQLARAISGMKSLIDKYAPVLDKALATGKIDLPVLGLA